MKGLSEKTIYNYECDLKQWFRFMDKEQFGLSILDATEDDISEFLFYCQEQGNNANRIKRRMSSISALYIFLKKKRLTKENPVELLDRPTAAKPVVVQTYLSTEQVALMKEKLKENGDLQLEVYALLSLSTMGRVNAISNIKWKQIDFEECEIREVLEKGDKVVDLFFNQEVKNLILKLKAHREANGIDTEYVFISTQELNTESNNGKSVKKVSFKTYFLKVVKRMRSAYDICQPSGELGEEESALAQCFMAIAGFVRKMNGTDTELDTETMNRRVSKMVEEALKYNDVESILEDGEQEDIFSPEYFEKLSDVKMPASKLEILVKMLRKQIKEYSKTNQMAAKKFQEMLEETIRQYHERRKHLTAEEAGEAQEHATEDIIRNATEQALEILKNMNADRESFRKIGLTFEEKAFYDILMALRNEYNFEYGTDKKVDGIMVNDKCKALAKKIKEIIDTKSSFADWLNNQIVRDQLKFDIKVCLIKNGYPPQYSPEVFRKVMEQVENFEENN